MSPLVTAPNRGYSDWQRIENYDTGILATVALAAQPGPVVTPVQDVSRYACLAIAGAVTTGALPITVIWWSDAAATIPVGRRLIYVSENILTQGTFTIPNLGPFVTVTLASVGGANVTCSFRIFATNRQHACEVYPNEWYALLLVNASILAGAQKAVFPQYYSSGPHSLWASTTQSTVFQICTLNTALSAVIITEWAALPPGTDLRDTIICPTGYWFVIVTNTTGVAASYDLTIQPSPTGSS